MFDESKHPRDGIGRFTTSDGMGGTHEATEAERERLKAYGVQDKISLPDEQLGRSIGAKWANYEIELSSGEKVKFLEGSKLHHKEVFAGKGTKMPIREVEGLVSRYGGRAEEWQKIKAFGTIVHDDGKTEEIEIHWYEEPTVGKVKLKEKVR